MADSIVILRPNGTVATGGFTTGSSSLFAAVNDDNDSTAISSHTYDEAIFDLSTFTIPANAQIRSFTLRFKGRDNTGGSVGMALFDNANGITYGNYYVNFEPSAFSNTYAVATIAPIVTMNQAAINALQVGIMPGDVNNSATLVVLEVYLDVAYNQQPTVSGVIIDSVGNPTPRVFFAYSDPESDTMERVQVKIFDSATYGAGGFDPETSTPAYDSGEIFTSTPSLQTTTRLVNGTTYKAYVKAADAGSNGRYSSWVGSTAFVSFYTVPTAPNTPTGTVNNSTGLINVASTGMSTNTGHIERSNDGGVIWNEVRGGVNVSGTFSVFDYEATGTAAGTSVMYRARASTSSGNFTLYSNYTATLTVTYAPVNWLLADPLNPADNIAIGVKSHKINIDENLGQFSPLGRINAAGRGMKVVVGDTVRGDDGTLEVITTTVAQRTGLLKQMRKQTALFLSNPEGESWYIRIIKRSRETTWTGSYLDGRQLKTWTLEYLEVDAP